MKSDLPVRQRSGLWVGSVTEACVVMTAPHGHDGSHSGLVAVVPNCLTSKVLTILVKRNEGSRLLETTVSCGGVILFDPSRLKSKSFKNKKSQEVKIHLLSLYSLSSSTENNIFRNTK